MTKVTYQVLPGEAITDDILRQCAALFSNHYAVWNPKAEKASDGKLVQGTRVKASPKFFKTQYISNDAIIAIVGTGEVIVGHAIAAICQDNEELNGVTPVIPTLTEAKVLWITQLVVHREYRGQGYASNLLRALVLSQNPVIVGIASSHPHGIIALKKASMAIMDKKFIRNIRRILTLCNVEYLVNKPLVGNLLRSLPLPRMGYPRLQVNTEFHIDHTEPLSALASLPLDVKWQLGPLLDGHEFIVIFRVGSNRRGAQTTETSD